MLHSPTHSVVTLSNVNGSQFKNYYNVDYYSFRHVVSRTVPIVRTNFLDKSSLPVPVPILDIQRNPKKVQGLSSFAQNDNFFESPNYLNQIKRGKVENNAKKLHDSNSRLEKQKIDLEQKYNETVLDNIFLKNYPNQFRSIQTHNYNLEKENKELEQKLNKLFSQKNQTQDNHNSPSYFRNEFNETNNDSNRHNPNDSKYRIESNRQNDSY